MLEKKYSQQLRAKKALNGFVVVLKPRMDFSNFATNTKTHYAKL